MHLIGALPLLGVQLNAVSLVNLTMVCRGALSWTLAALS